MVRPNKGSWRPELAAALAVGGVALVPRLAILAATPVTPPMYDMAEYWDRAVFVLQHGRLYENSTRMPGYPLALAAVLALFRAGSSLHMARLFNAVAGAFAAMLTYWLARRTAGRPASWVAALIVALYPSFLIYTTFTATEAVVTVPLVAALVAASYTSRRAAVVAGTCAGLTALVRPAGIAVLPAVLAVFVWPPWGGLRPSRRVQALGLAALAFAVVMVPWWVHSARLYGRFVPLDASGGINMAIGNNPNASGTYRWREARHLYALSLEPVEVATPAGSDRAAAVALRFVREHPLAFVQLVPRKLAALFALEGRELAHLYSIGFFGPASATVLWVWAAALTASFPLLVVSALGGLSVRGGIAPRVALPAIVFSSASIAMHLLSFGDPRYHLPMVPVLAVFATGLARAANGFSTRRLVVSALVLALIVVAWTAQFSTYWDALLKLTAPGGWQSQISYDDLL